VNDAHLAVSVEQRVIDEDLDVRQRLAEPSQPPVSVLASIPGVDGYAQRDDLNVVAATRYTTKNRKRRSTRLVLRINANYVRVMGPQAGEAFAELMKDAATHRPLKRTSTVAWVNRASLSACHSIFVATCWSCRPWPRQWTSPSRLAGMPERHDVLEGHAKHQLGARRPTPVAQLHSIPVPIAAADVIPQRMQQEALE
jgi:hypothetical protein